jgi:hypothetical protein
VGLVLHETPVWMAAINASQSMVGESEIQEGRDEEWSLHLRLLDENS